MATIGGVDLGIVKRESQSKTSGLFNQPLPYSDSNEAIIMDLLGTTRTITVNGFKTGTLTELRTFIGNIEGIQNGKQPSVTFVSSIITASKQVLIKEFSWDWVEADVQRLTYSLTLIEGSVIEST